MNKALVAILIFAALVSVACRKPGEAPGSALNGIVEAFVEPVRYDLKIDADTDSGTIAGDCALRIRNGSAVPIPVVPLNLYRLMEVASVRDEAGADLAFSQDVRVFEDWRELQVNHIRAGLRSPLAPGRETTLRIKYGGPLLGYAEAMRYVKDHVGRDLTLVRTDSFAYPQVGVPSWRTNRAAGLEDGLRRWRRGHGIPVAAYAGRLLAGLHIGRPAHRWRPRRR